MKLTRNLKEKVTEAAEHFYDVMKKEQYSVGINKKGVKVNKVRNTKDIIKWRAKNH